jgi:hypothetical protein
MIPTPTPEQMLMRGRSVIPVRIDKRPAIASWKKSVYTAKHSRSPRMAKAVETEGLGRRDRPLEWSNLLGLRR